MNNQRSLKEIAEEIIRDWQYPHRDAIPYLYEMRTNSIDDRERAMIVITLFLCFAHSWRGPTARRIKEELNTLFFMWYSLMDIAEDGKR